MNYQKIYDSIIFKAKYENRKKIKGGVYYENHHIIPKCLGGSNDKENLALLTIKEHFVAHKLLFEIHNLDNLFSSLWAFVIQKRRKYKNNKPLYISKNEYLRYRETYHTIFSNKFSGENNPNYGNIGELNSAFGKQWKSKTPGLLHPGYYRVGEKHPLF